MHCDTDKPDLHTGQLTVALAGNPNCGKTTIFNALTGLRQKVGNYAGVTVEKKTGRAKLPDGRWIDIIDLPGTYSMISRSPDERVAMEVLRGLRPQTPVPDVVIVVVDASNLQRNLYLVSQLIELGRPMVVALNMIDIAERRGNPVDAAVLEKCLGVPVVPVVGHKKRGTSQLIEAVTRAKIAPLPDWPLPDAMRDELVVVGGALAILGEQAAGRGQQAANTRRGRFCEPATCPDHHHISPPMAHYYALAERLLIGDYSDDLAPLTAREPVKSLLTGAISRLRELGVDPMQADIEAHYIWIDQVSEKARSTGGPPVSSSSNTASPPVSSPRSTGGPPVFSENEMDAAQADHGRAARVTLDYAPPPTLTERADRILIHRVWGLVIFTAIMGALFFSLFFIADPVMGFFEESVAWLGALVTPLLPQGPLADLWADGIVAGVGGVVVFVPQIALLFLFLAILEDSGYLARAAFLMDRLLRGVGLHGKSFIPLLSSFACAIPGIMATRSIEDRRDRLATIAVAPFMSCSARLPVYILLIGTFFAGWSAFGQAGLMLGLYVLGVVAAAGVAFVFRRTLLKGQSSAFILELPTYKIPQLSQIARTVGSNTWAFLSKAGTIIFVLSIILWAMAYYPRLPEERVASIRQPIQEEIVDIKARGATGFWMEMYGREPELIKMRETDMERMVAAVQLEHSISGRLGHLMEPVIKPLGYDWKMGVGLVAAFAAREVFVSQMGIVYSAGASDEDTTNLADAMRADTYADGSRVWTVPVALSLLVWFVLAMQCMSTLAIVRRETGGWTWPIFMIVYMNGLAYVAALLVYQIGIRLA